MSKAGSGSLLCTGSAHAWLMLRPKRVARNRDELLSDAICKNARQGLSKAKSKRALQDCRIKWTKKKRKSIIIQRRIHYSTIDKGYCEGLFIAENSPFIWHILDFTISNGEKNIERLCAMKNWTCAKNTFWLAQLQAKMMGKKLSIFLVVRECECECVSMCRLYTLDIQALLTKLKRKSYRTYWTAADICEKKERKTSRMKEW